MKIDNLLWSNRLSAKVVGSISKAAACNAGVTSDLVAATQTGKRDWSLICAILADKSVMRFRDDLNLD